MKCCYRLSVFNWKNYLLYWSGHFWGKKPQLVSCLKLKLNSHNASPSQPDPSVRKLKLKKHNASPDLADPSVRKFVTLLTEGQWLPSGTLFFFWENFITLWSALSCIKVQVVLEIIIEFLDLLNKISSHFFNITELLFCEINLYEKFKNPNFKVFFPFFYLFSFDNEFVFYRVPYTNITSVPFNITCVPLILHMCHLILCVPLILHLCHLILLVCHLILHVCHLILHVCHLILHIYCAQLEECSLHKW